MGRLGQRTKLTPELQEALCEHLRQGLYLKTACALVGIDVATVDQWRQRGEGTEPTRPGTALHVAFVDAVEKAKAEAVKHHVGIIREAAVDSWQAAAWHLERTQPALYGRVWRDPQPATPSTTQVNIAVQLGLSREDVASLLVLADRLRSGSMPEAELVDHPQLEALAELREGNNRHGPVLREPPTGRGKRQRQLPMEEKRGGA